MSIFGNNYRFSTFGESHSNSVGVIIETPIPNFELDLYAIQMQLNRRRPGQNNLTTSRNEKDELIVLSGMEYGKTLGTPLCIIVNNLDYRKEDYKFEKESYIPRPGHADKTYLLKYNIHASSGGGRSSARETIGRTIAGSIAEQFLNPYNISIVAFVSQVGHIKLKNIPKNITRNYIDQFITRCPDEKLNKEIEELILKLKEEGDSIGCKITCIIRNSIPGLGEPVFEKYEALLAQAMLSIPACKGFEIGAGFDSIETKGSELNDRWVKKENGTICTETNYSGGINGGISNGEDIYFNIAFKPPSTIMKEQKTLNLEGEEVILKNKGRHDPWVGNRAVVVVEAMTASVIYELLLKQISRTI